MNFSIYLDPKTGAKLTREAARSGRSRNSLITEAVKSWLDRAKPSQWPAELLEGGPEDVEPFESHRPRRNEKARFP